MKKTLKIVKFTILDSDVQDIKPSKLGADDELMLWIHENFPEVALEGCIMLRFDSNSEVVSWYDESIKGTHYVQTIYEES